jgi:hypothetical protein
MARPTDKEILDARKIIDNQETGVWNVTEAELRSLRRTAITLLWCEAEEILRRQDAEQTRDRENQHTV